MRRATGIAVRVLIVFFLLISLAAGGVSAGAPQDAGQSGKQAAKSQAASSKTSGSKAGGCQVHENSDYTAQIRKDTTAPTFITELVDHLPWSSCVPSPDAALGHIIGAPGVLDHTKDINAYMRLLEARTPRVKVFSIGKSEEGREMLIVAVSDEANIKNLERYRQLTAQLADPRGFHMDDAQAHKIVEEAKPIYWASGSIHSPETGSPEMLMELAYRLAVEDTPFIQKIRKDSIVLLTPIVETDGHDREVDIYTHRVNHREDTPYPLTWWGHYVAHDNNRDGMTLSLALSRNMMNAFLNWHVTVFHDLHESVPYLYISTGTGPYNPWLDPITISEWQEMAYHEIDQMTQRGIIGVWTHNYYDGWAPNYMFYLANGHNSIGRFYETFGNGGADTRERSLGAAQTSREWYRPNPPLSKVNWSARNNINMQESALLFGMNNLASNGQKFLWNFYLKSKRAVEKAKVEGPAAWVFPADDARPGEQARLLNLLEAQGIEISRLTNETKAMATEPTAAVAPSSSQGAGSRSSDDRNAGEAEAGGGSAQAAGGGRRGGAGGGAQRGAGAPAGGGQASGGAAPVVAHEMTFPAGSYIVRMDQPYSRMADMMLDTEYYNPRDPRSYDDTGWTMGALRNVRTIRVQDAKILDASMSKVDGPVKAPGGVNGSGDVLLIAHTSDNPLISFRFRLANVPMEAAEAAFEAGGKHYRAGSVVIRNAGAARGDIEAAAKDLGLTVTAVGSAPTVSMHPLEAPRIALMHNWQNTQQDGWYRIPLENLKVPYTYIADTRIRETANLRSQFDVIILPPMGGGLQGILRGIPERGKPMPWKNTAEMPNLVAPGIDETDDMRGGLGYQGLINLEKFVSDGGLLIAAGSSAVVPIQGGITEMISITDPRALQAPGIVALANVEDKTSPIAYGYDDKLYMYFHEPGPIFRVSATGGGFGGGGGAPGEGGAEAGGARGSGRGTTGDPDIIQGRDYIAPERPVRRSPREQELYVPEEQMEQLRAVLPPRESWPRVILRWAPERELMLSGELVGGNEFAEKPAVVDVPHGKGHVVVFSSNPMWRDETGGSYFLIFNAMMNWDHLDAGRTPAKSSGASGAGGEGDQQ